jgi:hypothetical protein
MRRFADTYWQLYRAVIHLNDTFDNKTLLSWIQLERVPRPVANSETHRRIERCYRLPEGYFKEKLPHQARSLHGHDPGDTRLMKSVRAHYRLDDSRFSV